MNILIIIVIMLQLFYIGIVAGCGIVKFVNRNKPKVYGLPYIPFEDDEPPIRRIL